MVLPSHSIGRVLAVRFQLLFQQVWIINDALGSWRIGAFDIINHLIRREWKLFADFRRFSCLSFRRDSFSLRLAPLQLYIAHAMVSWCIFEVSNGNFQDFQPWRNKKQTNLEYLRY